MDSIHYICIFYIGLIKCKQYKNKACDELDTNIIHVCTLTRVHLVYKPTFIIFFCTSNSFIPLETVNITTPIDHQKCQGSHNTYWDQIDKYYAF